MISGDGEITKLSDKHVTLVYLIKFEFASGTVYYTNWTQAIEWDGHVWIATGITPQVDSMAESSNLQSNDLNITLSPISIDTISRSLGDVSEYRGAPCSVYLAVLDDTFQLIGQAKLRWYGYVDTLQISTNVEDNGVSGTVNFRCENGTHGLSRIKGYRLNNAQQQVRVPGDKGFEYIEKLIAEPITWLSVKFQQQ